MSSPTVVVVSLMRPEGTTGVQTHVHEFVQYLRGDSQAVDLVTPFSAPLPLVAGLIALRRLLERVSPTCAVWLYRRGHAWLLALALRPRLRRLGAATVYAQCPVSAEVALRWRLAGQQQVVMVTHFNESQAAEWAGKGRIEAGGRLFRAIEAMESRVLASVDALVYVSEHARQQLSRRIPAVEAVRSIVIPNFVNDPFEVAPPPLCGDPPDSSCRDLLAIGTLEPRKNQSYLLDILAALRNQGLQLTLTIAGDGPDRAALQAKAQALGLADQVRLAGFVPAAASLFAQHRACIHVARSETQGICLIEAMAWQRPVFAAAVGGVPEVLVDGRQGRHLPLDDAAQAAKIIAEAWIDTQRMQVWGNNGRQRFVSTYRRQEVAQRLSQFLQTQPTTNGLHPLTTSAQWT